MVREYELMFIVRPDVDDDGLREAAESVETLVTGLGGEIEKTTLWGKRRLAYEVKHLRDGHYVISHFRLDGEKVHDVERALRIHDTVFRHLLVLRDGVADLAAGEEKPMPRAENGEAAAAEAPAESAPAATAVAESEDVAAGGEDEAAEAEEEEE